MTATAPAFRRGGEAATEASESQRGGSFRKNHFLSMNAGDKVFLRYLTDEPDFIFVDSHASFPTKNKPAGFEGNWPETMPTVCRYDPAFAAMNYASCYPCDSDLTNKWGRPYKPTVRVWALAVLREEVIVTKAMHEEDPEAWPEDMIGKRAGLRDQMREFEVAKRDSEGKVIEGAEKEKVIEPAFVIVNQAPSNYFDGLTAMKTAYGTVCDRDYLVQCKGEGKDKTFTHAPLDPTPNLKPGTDRWAEKYEKALEEAGIDLAEIVADRASDQFYARFIDPNMVDEQAKKDGAKSSSGSSAPDAPEASDNEPDQDKLAAMRDRIRAGGGKTAPAASDID